MGETQVALVAPPLLTYLAILTRLHEGGGWGLVVLLPLPLVLAQ